MSMKIDRILEIIIYLLNHDHVPASCLAERFQVSVRTIQRDMVSISSIGIPVYADAGKNGGYSILPNYKIKNTTICDAEQQLIIHALQSLATSYTNDTLNTLIEKYNAIIEKKGGQKVFWDFSVTKENQQVQDTNESLEQAICQKNYISFDYRNANGEQFHPIVQPLAIHYKWYAWYLFAYEEARQDYRTFKVARMEHLVVENRHFRQEHGSIEERMKESEQAYYQTCIPIEVQFSPQEAGLIKEYFPDCSIEKVNEHMERIFIHVPAKERLWKALLLSFGNKVTVVGPDSYRNELIKTAQDFLANYDI
ncbi:MAG: YafY family protein [Eubacteriales bacterium]|nr:YafY family protein [Eubacteriales bacterium]